MSSSTANLIIQYHIAAGEVDTNWLSLCNLVTQPNKKEQEIQNIIELHRQKLKNVKEQEDAIKLSEPHWYTSKKWDIAILVMDFLLGSVTLGVGIWDFKYQQDLPGNVQRTRALLGCLIAATVTMYVYTAIKGTRAWIKADVKKSIAKKLEDRRLAMRQQEKAFDLFCEYLKTDDPKLQTEKMKGIVHHLKQIPPEFGSAYKALDDFLSELIRVAKENEETKKLVEELVKIQMKRRSVEVPPKDNRPDVKDLKEKKPIEAMTGSYFLKLDKTDKAPSPQAKESFRLLQNVDPFVEQEKEIWAKIKQLTGHHFKKIRIEGEELINPIDEPEDHVILQINELPPAHGSIDVKLEPIKPPKDSPSSPAPD